MYDVIIIGSGPAGLTAAIYTIRASLKTLVIAGYKWGGQLMLTSTVENFPGFPNGIMGPDLMLNMRKQAENLGVEFVDKDAMEIDVSKKPLTVYTSSPQLPDGSRPSPERRGKGEVFDAKSVIIATGADTKWMDVPGEKELIGKGISSCAPCDAFFFRGKNVAVVGGGDSAMEEAHVLSKVANSVTIIYRGDKFRASKVMQERVLGNPKINVLWNTVITEVVGDNKLSGLKLISKVKSQKSKIQVKTQKYNNEVTLKDLKIDPSGVYKDLTVIQDKETEINWDLPIDGVFVAIGHRPNTMIFEGKIDLDEKGFVKRKEVFENNLIKYWSTTNVNGVFVAGDVSDYKYMQGITAAGFGCMAALDAQRWLEEKE